MADFKLGRLKFVWKGGWASSTAYVKDDIVSYGGNAFVAEEAFTSNADFYVDIDAGRWTKIAGGTEWKNTWTTGTYYKVDDLVKWGGAVYRCSIGHTAQQNLEDDISKWQIYATGQEWRNDWFPGSLYRLGDIVKIGGNTYICTTAHTADSVEFTNDISNWQTFIEGFNYRSEWSTSTQYEIGDVVKFGGNLYITTIAHLSTGTSLSPTNFITLLEGQSNGGEYEATNRLYKAGETVKYGGRSYICTQTYDVDVITSNPTDTNYWALLNTGFEWKGTWTNTTEYKLDDVVEYATSSYVCVQAHNASQDSGSSVVPGSDSNYWNLMSQGDSNAVMVNRGDIAFRDDTQVTNLPIGPAGSFLTSNGDEPVWGHITPQNDFFVSPQGDDTNDGRTSVTSWRTIKHACEQTFSLGQCRINVQAGAYEEQTPIRVGRSVVLEGNGLGAVTISPNNDRDEGFGVGVSDDGSTPNANSYLFLMNNGARLRNFVFRGFSTGSVVVSLDPGTGPDDTSVWITSQSPYVQNCTSFTPGGTGFKVDGGLHNGGYKSMVANDWTQINSDGIGIHVLNDGRSEIVSVFTYYCDIGYLAESGGKIRAIVGNNSYGEYGAVARGFSQSETPKTGNLRLPAATFNSIQTLVDGVIITSTFVDEDKNVYMCGYTSPITSTGNRPAYDNTASYPYLAKYDTGGNLLFQATYENLFGQFTSITQIDTSVYLGGRVYENATDKGVIFKITAAGDIQWQKTIAATNIINAVTTDGTRVFGVGDHNTLGSTLIRIPAGGSAVDFAKAIDFNDSSLNTLVPTAITFAAEPSNSEDTYEAAGDANAQEKLFIAFNDETNNATYIARANTLTGDVETSYYYGQNLGIHSLNIDTGNGDGIYLIAGGYYKETGFTFVPDVITYGAGINATYVSSASSGTTMALASGGAALNQQPDIIRDRKVRGVSSGETATIVSYDGANGSNIEITVANASGSFLDGENIELYQSGVRVPFIMRTNLAGEVQWQSSLRNIDGGEILATFGQGDVVYASGYQIDDIGSDIRRSGLITRYSSNGVLQWQKKIHNTTSFTEFNGIGVDGVNVISTGYTGGNDGVYVNIDRDASDIGTISGDFVFADAGLTVNNDTMSSQTIEGLDAQTITLTIADINNQLNSAPGFTNASQGIRSGFSGIGRGITFEFDQLSGVIKTGSVLHIEGDDTTYFVLQVTEYRSDTQTGTISIDPPVVVTKVPEDNTPVTFREAFSQVRMSGHDFLDIGTGGFADTNYPVIITADYTQQPDQTRETLSENGGRVFYVTTDQDGNFRVGDYFKVEQATGRASLSSEEFDLTGLNELQLGSVRAGKKGATVDEFSTDGTMADNSDTAVPTEKAVVTFVTDQLNAGSASAAKLTDADNDTQVTLDPTADGSSNVIQMSANSGKHFEVGQGYVQPSTGTTAQRPSNPDAGYMRYNTTTSQFEGHNGTQWTGLGGGNPWQIQDSAYSAVNGDRIFVDTSTAAVTITLPASPTLGDSVQIIDMTGSFQTNVCVIDRNGQNIMGDSADMTVDTENASFTLYYTNSTYGWRLGD